MPFVMGQIFDMVLSWSIHWRQSFKIPIKPFHWCGLKTIMIWFISIEFSDHGYQRPSADVFTDRSKTCSWPSSFIGDIAHCDLLGLLVLWRAQTSDHIGIGRWNQISVELVHDRPKSLNDLFGLLALSLAQIFFDCGRPCSIKNLDNLSCSRPVKIGLVL